MANELRFIETLDSSGFEKGIAQSTASMRKMTEEANLASKGIQGMFDTQAFAQAKQNFAGVEAIVKRFTSAMSHELPMKREMRETSLAAQGLEQIWRNLSVAEKQSAAGQELRSKIDTLIQRGGVLKDTMSDVSAAMKFQSSDTAKLDAVVGGVKTLAAGAQVAAGAFRLLGMSEEEATKAQADMMAVLSVVNGLQTIQNALQRESAVMQGLLALRTSALAAATSLKAAVTNADNIATKTATAAQWAWNAAISANPIGALIVAVGAVTAAIYKLNSAEVEASQETKELEAAFKEQTSTLASNIASLHNLKAQWDLLTSDDEKQRWIEENQKEFKKLGIEVNNTTDAESVFVKNTSAFINALTLRAQAAAETAIAVKQMQQAIEMREGAGKVNGWENFLSTIIPWGDKTARAQAWANDRAQGVYAASDAMMDNALDHIRRAAEKTNDANLAFNNLTSHKSGSTTSSHVTRGGGRSGRTSSTTVKPPTPEGSYAWFDEQIQMYTQLASLQTTIEERNKMLGKAKALQGARDVKFEGIPGSLIPQLTKELNEKLAKTTVKAPKLVFDVEDPIAEAKAKADALLNSTEGLRTAATAAASAFRSMGDAIGGQAGKIVNVAAIMAQAVATMIEGYAKATLQAAEGFGPWGWISFGLTGLGQLMAMISAVKSAAGFATGGIVGGTSYTGDRNMIRVNSGEMVLTRGQQASLWNALNGGGIGGGQVTFRISGQELVGVLSNYNSKMSKVR